MNNPYEILGVKETANEKEIRRAYYKIAKKTHPDVSGGSPHLTEQFRQATAAYTFLMDANRKNQYDSVTGNEYKEGYYQQYYGNSNDEVYSYERYFRNIYAQAKELQEEALYNVGLSLVFFLLGALATYISYLLAEPGETYRVYTGLLFIGAIKALSNLYQAFKYWDMSNKIKKEAFNVF